jgi:hypothetical protein
LLAGLLRPNGERLRELRALSVLEQIGTPAARRVLRELARGPAGSLRTQQARSALARLARRPPPSP